MTYSKILRKTIQSAILSLGVFLFIIGIHTAYSEGAVLPPLDVCASGCTYNSIGTAIAAAVDGDMIEIRGSISENATISIDKGVTITCSPAVTVDEVDYFDITADNVTIDGCEFTQSLTTCDSMGAALVTAYNGNDNIQITDNTIYGYAQALASINNNTNLSFTGNTVTEACAESTIYWEFSTGSIENNSFIQAASCFHGIAIASGDSSGLSFTTNTITNYSNAITGGSLSDFIISDNVISNTCTSGAMGAIIDIGGGPGTITGNEITSTIEEGSFINFSNNTSSSGDVYITDNDVISATTTKNDTHGTTGVTVSDSSETLDIYVEENTIKNNGYESGTYLGVGLQIGDANNMEINYNEIAGVFAYGIMAEGNISIDDLSITHNTFYGGSETTDQGYQYGIRFADYSSPLPASEISINTADIKDNIFAGVETALVQHVDEGEITIFDNDYNAYWDNGMNYDCEQTGCEIGENSLTSISPGFTDAENYDFSISNFSGMIGAASDGGNIGSDQTILSRETEINVGAGLDFETIDSAVDAAIDGDIIYVAAGTYVEEVSIANKEITIIGEGSATTIIDATGEDFGLGLSNVDNSTISGFTIRNADQANLYISEGSDGNDFSDMIITEFLDFSEAFISNIGTYSHGGTDYNGADEGEGFYFFKNDRYSDSSIVMIERIGEDITDVIKDTPQTWNFAMGVFDMGDAIVHMTIFVADESFGIFGDVEDFFIDDEESGMTFTETCWMDDALVYIDGAYEYTAPDCAGVTNSESSPEVVIEDTGAALMIASSDSNVIYNSTISNNILGVRFTGDAGDNEIHQGDNGVTFEGNTEDLVSSSSEDNLLGETVIEGVEPASEESSSIGPSSTGSLGGSVATPSESTEESGDTNEESTETEDETEEFTEPNTEPAEEPIPDDQSALDEATRQLDNQLNDLTSEEETAGPSLQTAELAEAIAEFEEESEEEVPVQEQTEEEIMVEEVLQGETDDEEALERVEELVREEISDSLEEAIEEAGDEGIIIHQDNEEVTINSIDDIEIVLGAGKDSADLLEAKESAKKRGKKLIVIKEDSNIDDDGISDVYQLTHNLPLFDKNPDDDDFDTADEVFLGMDPLSPDPLPTKPRITNANGVITGDTPSFRVTSITGDTVEVFIAKKDKDGRVAEFSTDSLMTNVLATLSSDYEPSKIGETVIDNEYKGEVTSDAPLENGEYYVIPKGEGGLGELSSFTVDNGEAPEVEALEVISKEAIGNGIETALKTASAFTAFDYEKYIDEKIAESGVQKDTVIVRGEATPGSIILITWKSVIISSVVVSDASQGKFELEVPKALVEGDHNIITYALDEKTNAMSSAKWLLFRK